MLRAIWKYSNNRSTTGIAGEVQVTFGPGDKNAQRWSNDGKLRYLIRLKGNQPFWNEANSDGTDSKRLDWYISPDRTKALIPDPSDPKYSFLANADGSNQRRLPVPFGNNDWSKVSNELVVQTEPLGKRDAMDIGIINLDTLEFTNITNSPTFEADPSFSPDGQKILFTSTRDGNAEIYIMNRDGSNVERLTNNPAWESFATFSPDMTQITFNSDRDNERNNVFILNFRWYGLKRYHRQPVNIQIGLELVFGVARRDETCVFIRPNWK